MPKHSTFSCSNSHSLASNINHSLVNVVKLVWYLFAEFHDVLRRGRCCPYHQQNVGILVWSGERDNVWLRDQAKYNHVMLTTPYQPISAHLNSLQGW
jgi:hypothetical protein